MEAQPWTFDPQIDPHAFRALGFAASSAGIARRQRQYREGWWAHAERSKAFILDAALRVSQPRLAVVLGAGKAYDLPLGELAQRFARVVLVDIDAAALADTSAAAVRDAGLRSKLELRALDLTGVTARLVREIEAAMAAAADAAAAEARYDDLCRSYRLAAPPRFFEETADLIVSGLMLTQLALPAKLLAKRLFEERFGPVTRESEPRWVAAWDGLDLRMQQDHIAALARQARLAVLTSEVIHHVTALDARGNERPTGESWSLIGADSLERRLPSGVELLAQATWPWPRLRPSARDLGARMQVAAVFWRA